MLSDEERVELILGDGHVADDDERADAAFIAAVLADPATWGEPPDTLEDLVVGAIRAEAALDHPRPVERPRRPSGRPVDIRRGLLPLIGVAAAGVVGLGIALAVQDDDDEPPIALATLESQADPAASGSAEIFDAESGFAIRLDLAGLPSLPDDGFYEAWVRDEAGTLVSIGTFSQSAGPITLWAGVDPCRFDTITITRERPDGDPASSGDRVLAGPVDCAT